MQNEQYRKKSKEDLEAELQDLRKDLSELRVAQVAQGQQSAKLNRIKETRKKIARVLTVISHQTIAGLRAKHANAKYLPLDLRPKLTRALRRRLTKEETHVKATGPKPAEVKKLVPRVTLREAKKRAAVKAARVVYAVKAE